MIYVNKRKYPNYEQLYTTTITTIITITINNNNNEIVTK